jgi:hypothetical protein
LALQILNVTASTALPGKPALVEALDKIRMQRQGWRREVEKLSYVQRRQRHQDIRRRADGERAKTRVAETLDPEYKNVMEEACRRLMSECSFVPEQVLLALHQVLPQCIEDCQSRRKRRPFF